MQVVSESLASILLNSSNLLRIDLDGVNVLAPSLLTALEAVLPEKEVRSLAFLKKEDEIEVRKLRRLCMLD